MITTDREFRVPVELHLLEGECEEVSAAICGVRNSTFLVSSPVHLRLGRRLTMVHPDARMAACVAGCAQQAGGGYQLGILLADDLERRSAHRTAADWPAMLRALGSLSATAVRITDISASGLGLELPTALAVGASVSIEWRDGTAVGEICHCAKRVDRYRAGVRVQEFSIRDERKVAFTAETARPSSSAADLARALQQRQAKYLAILFSLAPAATSCSKNA